MELIEMSTAECYYVPLGKLSLASDRVHTSAWHCGGFLSLEAASNVGGKLLLNHLADL